MTIPKLLGYGAWRSPITSDLIVAETIGLSQLKVRGDDTFWVELDSMFHIAVAQASGNPVFGKVIEEMREALATQSAFLNRLGGRREASNAEHRRIVDAIADGAPGAASEAMTVHLEHVDQTLVDIVGNNTQGSAAGRRPERRTR